MSDLKYHGENAEMTSHIYEADTLEWAKAQPDNSIDMVICSPPYEDARTYGIGFKLKGQAWVDWAVERFKEHSRICRGLVCWVVEGKTRNFQWSATPALMMADLHRAGIRLRKPPAYQRYGIPGGGGKEWLRNDYEFVICSSKGKLPWAHNTAMGNVPKFKVGGRLSHRHKDGQRIGGSTHARKVDVAIANPGNIIRCGAVGGGNIGSDLAHENEAPFPESLVEFFVRSFCPPGGTVYDGFCGSGTTGAVCEKWGRNFIGTDVRASQVELTQRRLDEARAKLGASQGESKSDTMSDLNEQAA